ncbi:MAG TPA: MerR family transcriptional regulator [Longimicrobiaceae bacterium]|nr:MerR family transcriptional regulator [Longimicrobiaceae bacterium]
MEQLSIGEVARRTGLRTSAIRYYEDAGVLPPPPRVNGRRRYGPEAVRTIGVLRFAQQAGFTLDEVRTLFHGFGAETPLHERWEALAQAKLRDLDALIARAHGMRRAIEAGLGCGCVRVEDCVLPDHDHAGDGDPYPVRYAGSPPARPRASSRSRSRPATSRSKPRSEGS